MLPTSKLANGDGLQPVRFHFMAWVKEVGNHTDLQPSHAWHSHTGNRTVIMEKWSPTALQGVQSGKGKQKHGKMNHLGIYWVWIKLGYPILPCFC